MTVAPEFVTLLEHMASSGVPPLSTMTVEQARDLFVQFDLEGEREEVAHIEDRIVATDAGQITVRVYSPTTDEPTPGIVVWFHGGGWVLGSVDAVDPTCRRIARRAGAVVVSVDYRLAPEHPFPAAVEDGWAAVRWVAEHASEIGGDASRLAVGGDSAGANIATVVALMARDAGGPTLAHQALVYPVVDFSFSQQSYTEYGTDYFLTTESMKWFRSHYLGESTAVDDWRASPLRVPDVTGLPSTHVVAAQYDPLRDEGLEYAARLRAAGVTVELDDYHGMIHGFVNMAAVTPVALTAIGRVAEVIRKSFAGG